MSKVTLWLEQTVDKHTHCWATELWTGSLTFKGSFKSQKAATCSPCGRSFECDSLTCSVGLDSLPLGQLTSEQQATKHSPYRHGVRFNRVEEIPLRKGMDHEARASVPGGVSVTSAVRGVLEGESYSTPGEHILQYSNPKRTHWRSGQWSGGVFWLAVWCLVSLFQQIVKEHLWVQGDSGRTLAGTLTLNSDLKCSASNGAKVKC